MYPVRLCLILLIVCSDLASTAAMVPVPVPKPPLPVIGLEPNKAQVQIPRGPSLTVEYAGAAPGLLAGVTQINIKLPDVIPEVPGFPRGVLPLLVQTPGVTFYPGYVTVAVTPD